MPSSTFPEAMALTSAPGDGSDRPVGPGGQQVAIEHALHLIAGAQPLSVIFHEFGGDLAEAVEALRLRASGAPRFLDPWAQMPSAASLMMLSGLVAGIGQRDARDKRQG